MSSTPRRLRFLSLLAVFTGVAAPADFEVEIRQLTHGAEHHFFGYIGHVQNIPWSGDSRYIVALRTPFQTRIAAGNPIANVPQGSFSCAVDLNG